MGRIPIGVDAQNLQIQRPRLTNKIMQLPSDVTSEFDRVVTQRTWGAGGHTYVVDGFPCDQCAACRGGGKRYKVPTPEKSSARGAISTIAGTLQNSGGLYNAGRNSVINALFGDPEIPGDIGFYSPTIKRDALRERAINAPSKGSISREYGTAVHEVVEQWMKCELGLGPEPFIADEYYEPALRIVEWMEKNEWKILDVEATVYEPYGSYAGTADCIASRGDSRAIFDWKTGGGIYPESALQIAGYACAYEAITNHIIDEGYILRSNAEGFEVKRVSDFEHAKTTFKAIVGLRKYAIGATDFETLETSFETRP